MLEDHETVSDEDIYYWNLYVYPEIDLFYCKDFKHEWKWGNSENNFHFINEVA